jgi:hypothetical protein
MKKIGKDDVSPKKIRDEVLLRWPNLNFASIHTTGYVPKTKYSSTIYTFAKNLTDPLDLNTSV